MVLIGLLVTLAGCLVSVAGLGLASSTHARLAITIVGIGLSLFGIMGLINPAYLKHAIWKGEK